MAGKVEGRRFIITGAASGIGRATAELFAREGAAVALADVSEASVREVAASASAKGFVVDVSDRNAVRHFVTEAVDALGGLDGVINVAGIHRTRSVEEASDADWDDTLSVNLTGPYTLIQAALPFLRQATHPTIVNVASATALLPTLNNMSAYVASKGGLVALSKALAYELAPHIRVNTVCPGLIATGLTAPEHIAFAASPESPYMLKRIADPSEVASGILYLSCTESSFVTGVALAIDGGRTFH